MKMAWSSLKSGIGRGDKRISSWRRLRASGSYRRSRNGYRPSFVNREPNVVGYRVRSKYSVAGPTKIEDLAIILRNVLVGVTTWEMLCEATSHSEGIDKMIGNTADLHGQPIREIDQLDQRIQLGANCLRPIAGPRIVVPQIQ